MNCVLQNIKIENNRNYSKAYALKAVSPAIFRWKYSNTYCGIVMIESIVVL